MILVTKNDIWKQRNIKNSFQLEKYTIKHQTHHNKS